MSITVTYVTCKVCCDNCLLILGVVSAVCTCCACCSAAVCAAGYGNVGGVCTECPAGTYSEGGPVANTTCLTCDDGRSSLKGASSCVGKFQK
jgi:hypothetical protein